MKKSIALLALGIITLLAPTTASADDCRHSSRSYTRISTRSYFVPQLRFLPSFAYYPEQRCATRRIVYEEPCFDRYGRRIVTYPSYRVGGYIRFR